MATWHEITRDPEYQELTPEGKSLVKKGFFDRVIAADPEYQTFSEDTKKAIFDDFWQTPDDTGQGYVTSMLGAAGRGFGEMVPGAIEGVGALTGSEGLREFGQEVRGGLEDISPVNPIYGESIPVKLSELGGQIGSVLATAGAGGLAGKALGGVGAVSKGAQTAALGSAFLQGSAEGAREAEQYGMSGPEAYLRTLAGGATEAGTELLPFGMAAETSLAKRLLTGAPRTGTFLGAVGSEAGEEGLGQIASNIATKTLAPAGVETPDITAGALEAAAYGAAGGAMLGGVNALISTPPERQTQIQKDLQAEAGAIPKDTVPDQTNEEKMAAMEKGGVTVVSPDGKTAVIAPEPSMPDPTEVAKTIGDASVEQLAATGNKASAAAQADFNAILAETLGETAEPTIQPEQEAEKAGAEVTPLSEGVEENPVGIHKKRNAVAESLIVRDAEGGVNRAETRKKVKEAAEKAGLTVDEFTDAQAAANIKANEDFFNALNEGDVLEWTDANGRKETGRVEVGLNGKKTVRNTTEGSSAQDYQYTSKSGIFSQVANTLKVIRKNQKLDSQPQPVETQEDAAREIPLEESLRQEPQDRIESREAEETGAGDQLLRSAEGEEEVVQPPVAAAPTEAPHPFPNIAALIAEYEARRKKESVKKADLVPQPSPNLAALIAVRDNTATPEQVQSLVDQGLAKQVGDQNIITEAGVAAMPEGEKPRLTPAERAAEVEGTAAPGGVASPIQQTPKEKLPEYQIRGARGRPATDAEGVSTGWKLNEFRDAVELVSEDGGKFVVFPIENPSSYGDKMRALLKAEDWAIDNPIRAQIEASPMEANYGAGRVEDVSPKTVKFVHTTKTKPGKGQKTGYYPGTYAYESESGLLPSMEGNKFVGELPESDIYTLKDADQLKKDAADAGFGRHSGNGNAEVKYLQSLGFKAMRRPSMGGTEIIVFDTKDANFQPQTTAAEKQTPVPLREGTGAAGVVQSEPVEGSIPTDEKVSPETESESRGNLPAVEQIDRLVQSGAKPEEMDKFIKSLSDDQFNELVASEAFDVDPKLAIKPNDTYDAKRIKRRKFVDAVNASTKEVRKTAQQVFQEEEAAAKKQQAGEEMRSKAIDSIIGASEKKKRKFGQVTNSDAIAAVAMLVSSKDVPGVLTTWTGTKDEFLRDPANQLADPEIYARIKAGELVEGFFNKGRAYVFLDGIGVSDEDMLRGEQMSVTPQVAAVRRVLLHESLVHRGIHGLPLRHRRLILNWVRQNSTPTELDDLAKLYTEYANWRNSDYEFEALAEELLAKKVDSLTEIPKDGPMAKLMDILRQIWDFIVGYKREPTLSDLKSVIKLLKSGAEALSNDRLKDGGEVKLSMIAPTTGITPEMDAEYLAAVEAGDMEKAQRMVDEAAKAAGYNRKGVRFGFYVNGVPLPPSLSGSNFGPGYYVAEDATIDLSESGVSVKKTPNKKTLQELGLTEDEVKFISGPVYVKAQNPIPSYFTEAEKKIIEAHIALESSINEAFIESAGKSYLAGEPKYLSLEELTKLRGGDKLAATISKFTPDYQKWQNAVAKLLRDKKLGGLYPYDSKRGIGGRTLVDKSMSSELVVPFANQIKSANPVTFDNAGNIIPLSQRFQTASPDIRFSRPQFSSETSAAFTAGSEAARSTLYSERDMDIREAIRRAYEAMPKPNSVAVPIGELFAKTEELMPGVTQEEFSLVLQDLFEDNGAVLQEGDSDFIVTTPEGKRAGFVVVMPRAAKASRIKAEDVAEASKSFQADIVEAGKGRVDTAAYQGRPLKGVDIPEHNVNDPELYDRAVSNLVDLLERQGYSLIEIADSIQDRSFQNSIGLLGNENVSANMAQKALQAVGIVLQERLQNAANKEGDPVKKRKLEKAVNKNGVFWSSIETGAGQLLQATQYFQGDPKRKWMFLFNEAEKEMADKAKDKLDTITGGGTQPVTDMVNQSEEAAADEATNEMTSDAEGDQDAIDLAAGEETLTGKLKELYEELKDLIREEGVIAGLMKKAGSMAKASLSAERRNELASMTVEQLKKRSEKNKKRIGEILEALLGKESDAKTPEQKKTRAKRKKMVDTAKKRAEAGKEISPEEKEAAAIEMAENKASQIVYRFEELYRQGFKNPPEGMSKKEQKDSIIKAFRDQVKNPTSFEAFAERLANLKVGAEVAERMFITASRERADLIRVKDFKIAKRKVEIADKQASRLIYSTEERFRQGSKDLNESKDGDSINKAFRDQVSTPVSEADFSKRLAKLNVSPDVATRLFKTAAREKSDLEAMEAFKLLEGPDSLKRMLAEINKARPGQEAPFSKQIPWREILSQKAKTVEEYRQRIFDAISANEAFQNLSDEQKGRLSDLFSEAWESKRTDILDRMLEREIERKRKEGSLSEAAAKALQKSRNKIIELANLGGFDNDDLMKVLGEKFGIKTGFSEAEKARISELADKLQDETLNPAKRNKLAMEFAVTLAGASEIPVSEIIANWWTSSVLFGPQTIFSIGAAFVNGAYSITTIGTRRMLADLTRGDVKGAIEESILMLQGIAKYLGAFKQAGRRAWSYLWTGNVDVLGAAANDILGEINSLEELKRFKRHKLLAENLAKDPRALRRYVGMYLRFVNRLLTSLDAFNVMVTKAGTASLALRMSGMSTDNIIKAEKMLNLKAYKDQVIRDYFDNKAPRTLYEKGLVDSYAEAEMYRAINKLGGKMENADYLASESAMTMNPTGLGGFFYRSITGLDSKMKKAAEDYLEKAKKDWITEKDLESTLFLGLAYLRQFAVQNLGGVAGYKFIRFASNKFNQGISYLPMVGLLRTLEAKGDDIKGKEAFIETIHRNQVIGAVLTLAAIAVVKAIEDEPDDEERGNFWNGGWQNLTPDQKKQMLAKGQKEYTMGFKFNGRWYVFNYQNWPMNQVLAAIGSMSDQIRFSPKQWEEKGPLSKSLAGIVSGLKSTLEIPALSQLGTLVGNRLASKDPTEQTVDRLSNLAAGWVGGFVPRILKDLDFATQPELRKYKTLWEKTASHIPIYRRYVGEDYYDILGQPIKRNVIPGSREFMMGPTEPEYKILGALNSRNIFLTPANAEYRMVGKGRNRRRLTQEEADAYSLETGKGYRQMLLRYGQRALQMPTERARAFLSDKADEVRDRALKKVFRR